MNENQTNQQEELMQQTNDGYEELTRVVEPEAIKMTAVERLIGIFIAPGQVMENVRHFPVIFMPFLFAAIIGIISIVPNVRMTNVMTEEMSHISIERYGVDFFDFSAALDEYGSVDMGAIMDGVMTVTMVANAFITPFIYSFIAALGIFILCKICGGPAKFVQIFSMYMHVYVILALGGLVTSSFIMFTGRFIDPTTLASIMMPQGRIDDVFFNILSSIGIFPIWATVLAFVGVKVLNNFCNVKSGVIVAIALVVSSAVYVVSLMSTWWMYDRMMAAGLF